MSLNILDILFKSLRNKRFTTPNRLVYQEESIKTQNVHKDEIWIDTIPALSSNAVISGVAVLYDKQILTADPVYPNNVFFVMQDSGTFVAGINDYEEGILNNALRTEFISDKYVLTVETDLLLPLALLPMLKTPCFILVQRQGEHRSKSSSHRLLSTSGNCGVCSTRWLASVFS